MYRVSLWKSSSLFAYQIYEDDGGDSEADVTDIYARLLEQVLGWLQAFYLEESSAFVDYLPPKPW